jgi:hypothetical protein
MNPYRQGLFLVKRERVVQLDNPFFSLLSDFMPRVPQHQKTPKWPTSKA